MFKTEHDIKMAKGVSGVLVLIIFLLGSILLGALYGWAAFFICLIGLGLLAFLTLRMAIAESEKSLAKASKEPEA